MSDSYHVAERDLDLEVHEPKIQASSEPEIMQRNLPEKHTRYRVILILAGGALLALAAGVVPKLLRKPPQYIVSASGRIEGREVTLAPKEIQGRVKALLVDEGNTVKRGPAVTRIIGKPQ